MVSTKLQKLRSSGTGLRLGFGLGLEFMYSVITFIELYIHTTFSGLGVWSRFRIVELLAAPLTYVGGLYMWWGIIVRVVLVLGNCCGGGGFNQWNL